MSRILFRALIGAMLMVLVVACASVAERNNGGNRHHDRGNFRQAITVYQGIMVANPDDPVAYYNMASSLAGLEIFERAVEALEQAIALADDDLIVDAYYNLGNVFFEQGLYLEAVNAYQQALLIDPNDDDARYNLELALQRYIPPSPTAIEQQTNPELGQSDPETTPTNEPGGFDGPTPTPPPMESSPDPSQTPDTGDQSDFGIEAGTPIPDDDGSMTIEQAEAILDVVQQDQETLNQFLEDETTSGEPADRDW